MKRNKEVQNYMFGKGFYISREKNHWIGNTQNSMELSLHRI